MTSQNGYYFCWEKGGGSCKKSWGHKEFLLRKGLCPKAGWGSPRSTHPTFPQQKLRRTGSLMQRDGKIAGTIPEPPCMAVDGESNGECMAFRQRTTPELTLRKGGGHQDGLWNQILGGKISRSTGLPRGDWLVWKNCRSERVRTTPKWEMPVQRGGAGKHACRIRSI